MQLAAKILDFVGQARESGIRLEEIETEVRKQTIIHGLILRKGNVCQTAKDLGMHRNTLSRNIDELDIDVEACRGNKRPVGRATAGVECRKTS